MIPAEPAVLNRPDMDFEEERTALACAFRWAARFDMHEAVANHFSLAVNRAGTRFLMNPKGRHFSRVRASELLLHAGRFNCRGVTYWRDPDAAEANVCAHRILLATNDRRLAAVDARNGESCADFGENGFVDVTPIIEQLRPTSQLLTMQLNSPGAVVNGVIVIGGTAAKFSDASSTNGAVRAFSARTGEHLWTFDTLIREPADDPESSAWHVGGANAWTTFSWENESDLVFIPTASPSPDFYGGKRPGDNLYGNSLVVLRASTGELVWHYQILKFPAREIPSA